MMTEKHEILKLLKDRLQILSGIRDFYLRKQKSLLETDPKTENKLEKLHQHFLQELLLNETEWKKLIKSLREVNNIPSENPDIIVSLVLDEEIITQYFAYKDRIHQSLHEINRIKTNFDLLAKDAFPFSRSKTSGGKSRHLANDQKKIIPTRIADPSEKPGKK